MTTPIYGGLFILPQRGMMRLDEPGAYREYQPKLACWIGINEAILLQHFHTEIEKSESQLTDGRMWIARTITILKEEFPFWDHSIIKRTIKNLKGDSLLKAKTSTDYRGRRFTWYTIDYAALSQLTGPVDRMLDKNQKRRQARDSRQFDKRPGYVYLCDSPERPGYKIGLTSDIRTRMGQLGANLIHSVPTNDMLQTEQGLHQKFSHRRLDGEWFDLSEDDIGEILSMTNG